MAKAVQSQPPSPSPKYETASSRNSIKKWYKIWELDTSIIISLLDKLPVFVTLKGDIGATGFLLGKQ